MALRKSLALRALIIVPALLTIGAASAPLTVIHWDEPAIATGRWESHAAIDPRTGDLWFVRSDPSFSGWRILVARCARSGVAAPVDAPIAGPGIEADPYFADAGATLYFISSRANGGSRSADLDLWLVRRTADGQWGAPERLPAPVNSDSAEWFPRPTRDGWLYFGSRRPGGFGKDDIWRAKKGIRGWVVENAGPAFNTSGAEYEFQPAPDGTWGILSTDQGLFRMTHGPHGWTDRTRLGPEINATGTEIGPAIAPDGHAFLFSRDAGDGRSGELYVASDGKRRRTWPQPCRKAPR